MASFQDYTYKKLKKEKKDALSFQDYTETLLGVYEDDEEDIAPVIEPKAVGGSSRRFDDGTSVRSVAYDDGTIVSGERIKRELEEEGKLNFFQKGAFKDGYQFGDVTRALLGTAGDAGVGVVKGGAGLVEGLKDAGQYGVAGVAGLFGADEYAEEMKKKAQKSSVQDAFKGVDNWLDQYSLLGSTSDSITQGLGQVGTLILTGGLGAAGGLGTAGVTALTTGTMGVSSMGSGMSDAYNDGATDGEALAYGVSKGVIDAGTELLFGGLGKAVGAVGLSRGISSLDDVFAQRLSSGISNQVAKNLVEFGVKASGEGFEEVLAGLGTSVAKKLTYMDEEELTAIIEDENLLEQFIVGTVTSGMIQSGYIPGTANGSLKDANAKGSDFITGYTQNEQSVINKLVDNEVEKQEADGKKLTNKEIGEIEKQVKNSLERGEIDIDTIESVLGGETYSAYDTLLKESKEYEELYNTKNSDLSKKQEDRLAELTEKNKKSPYEVELSNLRERLSQEVRTKTENDTFLLESYNEKAKKSRTFEADLNKYDEKQQETVKKAIDSGILNDTKKTHEFVDMLAKLSAEKGVSFDFMNNEKLKESGFAIEGKTINGFVKDGNIALNINSNKALNTVVGHEITHVLEGTALYSELQTAITEYAKSKGDYDSRFEAISKLYEGVENVNVENELTADLVGDYLFTDSNFINNLSTTKPNVFKRIYNEIKYLLKLATAGSQEARQLEKVKKAFDRAYREGGKSVTETKAENVDMNGDAEVKYSLVNDESIIDFLENQEHITTYKSMQLIDGKLYPPMSAEDKGTDGKKKLRASSEIGKWQQADENPSGIKKFAKGGYGMFTLHKGNGKSIDAAYNPYEHSSNLVLNDQFEEAYKRPNLVTVECHIPVSEMTSGYKAEHAKDATGLHDWKAGTVAKQLKNNNRKVYLTRWLKPVRVLSDAEVAQKYKEILGDDISVPFNVVSPSLLSELEKAGVSIDYDGSPMYQAQQKRKSAKEAPKFSLTADTEGRTLTKEQKEYFKDSKVVDENGRLKVMYHGTEKGGFHEFIPNFSDDGNSFFFTDNNETAKTYSGTHENYSAKTFKTAEDFNNFFSEINAEDYEVKQENGEFVLCEDGDEVARSNTSDGLYEEFRDWTGLGSGSANYKVYLNLTNPLMVDAKNNNWDELPLLQNKNLVEYEYLYFTKGTDGKYNVEFVDKSNKYGEAESLEMTIDEIEKKFGKYVSEGVTKGRKDFESIAVDKKTRELIPSTTRQYAYYAKNNGYDGVYFANIIDNGLYASGKEKYNPSTVAIAFNSNQIKSVENESPTKDADIRHSLGDQDIAPTGKYNVYGKDIALETETENVAPAVEEKPAVVQEVVNYAPMTEAEANERDAMQSDRLNTLTESDMPEEIAPYYDEELSDIEAESPFEDKDIQEVGNRKQKAYMYENPEVKPYFQEEAQVMLGELRNSIKGEKHFNDQLYYDTGGEQGWYGTKRETSEQIAYMLDRFKYTYADIEKGLKAIVEDHGAENNAISKRLEFMIDERLREGYTDFVSGVEIPSNQEYINLLRDKQINTYSDEAYNQYLESLAYAEPTEMVEDIAPMPEADAVEVLYSLEEQQQEKVAEIDSVVNEEDLTEPTELPTVESYDVKLENYKNALEGYKNAKATIEAAFDEAISKKTAEYNALKRKDTKKAANLLMQIENLKLRKSNNANTLDSKIAKVTETIDKLSNGIPTKRQIYHRNIVDKIKNAFSSKGYDFDKVLETAKNKGTFSSVDNTPQRFIEKSLGYKEGQILNDLTINKVAQNETQGIAWLNSFTDKKSGLLAKISKEYGIKPRSKESAAAQMYAEGFWVDDDGNFIKYGDAELAQDYPDARIRANIKKLAKDERIRKIYDETLGMINESRKRNLYPEIPRRNNYFLHFREMDDTFSRLGIPFNPNDIKLKDLPTDINGMTADLKPGQPYFASAKQRLGYKTTYDLVGGVERYLNSAKNQIYHIDDIQTLRALRNYIADTFGQAKGLESLDSMTEEEAVARIEEVYNSHLSTFAKFLNEEANILAGKTSLTDRGLEGVIGRRGIQFLDTVNRQVGSNMVGANVSSALTNTISTVQAFAKSNKFDATKAFAQTVSNKIGSLFGKSDGFAESNPMMIRRKGIERLTMTPWERITDKGYLLMSAIDSVSSEFIARTKFNELIRKGMSEQQAHIEADKWASRVLGDRSLGQQPQLYNSKMLGLITKFQLEVRNQLDSQFYDTIQEAKVSNEEVENRLLRNAKISAKVASTFFQLAVLQHLFGKAFESLAGYNPAFDIVEVLMQVFGLDDDEESEDTVLDNLEEGFLTLLGDLPYTSTLTGGRVPIASALPIEQFITGKDDYGNEKSRWETIKETAPYYLLPTGYGQIKKTTQGLAMFDDELPIAGSYTDSGNLRYSIEDTPANRLKSAIFGQYSSDVARDYFDNERAPLKEKQIDELIELDIPIKDYWEYREGLKEQDTLEEKFDYIAGLDFPVEKKNIMINNIVDRKEEVDLTNYDDFANYDEFDFSVKNPEKYEYLRSINVSYDEYSSNEETKDAYDWAYQNPEKYVVSKAIGDIVTYRQYSKAINKFEADKDENGKSISGSKKEKVTNYISSLDIDYGQKIILYRSIYDGKEDKNTYNLEIVEYLNGRNDITYEEMVDILESLDMTVLSDGTVRW